LGTAADEKRAFGDPIPPDGFIDCPHKVYFHGDSGEGDSLEAFATDSFRQQTFIRFPLLPVLPWDPAEVFGSRLKSIAGVY
jgi:hypothetical protein